MHNPKLHSIYGWVELFSSIILITNFHSDITKINYYTAVAYREGGLGVFKHPPRNSEDIGEVLDHISKKNRCLDFHL